MTCAYLSHEEAFKRFKSADSSHPFTLKSRWREKTNEIFCQTLDPDFQPSGLVIFGFCSSSSGTMSGVGSIINRSRFVLFLEGLILPFGARWCPKISSIFLNPPSSAKGLTGASLVWARAKSKDKIKRQNVAESRNIRIGVCIRGVNIK